MERERGHEVSPQIRSYWFLVAAGRRGVSFLKGCGLLWIDHPSAKTTDTCLDIYDNSFLIGLSQGQQTASAIAFWDYFPKP